MATAHVFIVDSNTFKYHIEYMFAGTGAGNNIIDFNNTTTTTLHSKTESNLVGMMADIGRIRIGDDIIFYLQQNYSQGIREGKFFGIFRVVRAGFLDNNDNHQFLAQQLNKSLTFRVLIEANNVYAQGITEWEALDEITNIVSPNQMQWSLIYRKLKGNRGNTMITIYEASKLKQLIQNKNNRINLVADNYTFDSSSQEIVVCHTAYNYTGRQTTINILPRLINKYCNSLQFETHLQANLLQHLETLPFLQNGVIEWIGNEVSCGVGMQRIDIMLSLIRENNKVCIPIELKSTVASPDTIFQLQRYIDWIKQYYIPNNISDIEPMVISREITNKQSQSYSDLISSFNVFNHANQLASLKYIEFSIDCDNTALAFTEINY